jgi:hypothetical protein
MKSNDQYQRQDFSQDHQHQQHENGRALARCDGVIWECIAKTAEIILRSRCVVSSNDVPAVDDPSAQSSARRFNLETESIPSVRNTLLPWKKALHIPLQLDVFYHFYSLDKQREERILLERWCFGHQYFAGPTCSDPRNGSASSNVMSDLRQVVKKIVILMRTLHCHARLLPAYSIHCYLTQCIPSARAQRQSFPAMQHRASEGTSPSMETFVGYAFHGAAVNKATGRYDTPDPYLTRNSFKEHDFRPVTTPFGRLQVKVWYHPKSTQIATAQLQQANKTSITAPIPISASKKNATTSKLQPTARSPHSLPCLGSKNVSEFLIQNYSPTPEILLRKKTSSVSSVADGKASDRVGSVRTMKPSMSGLSLALMQQQESEEQSPVNQFKKHHTLAGASHAVGEIKPFSLLTSEGTLGRTMSEKHKTSSSGNTCVVSGSWQNRQRLSGSPTTLMGVIGASPLLLGHGDSHSRQDSQNADLADTSIPSTNSGPPKTSQLDKRGFSNFPAATRRNSSRSVLLSAPPSPSARHLSTSPAPFAMWSESAAVSFPLSFRQHRSTQMKQQHVSSSHGARHSSFSNGLNASTSLRDVGDTSRSDRTLGRPPSPPFGSHFQGLSKRSETFGEAQAMGRDPGEQQQQGTSVLLPHNQLEKLRSSPFKLGLSQSQGDPALPPFNAAELDSAVSASIANPLVPVLQSSKHDFFLRPLQNHSIMHSSGDVGGRGGAASLLNSSGALYAPGGGTSNTLYSHMSSLSFNTRASGVGESIAFGGASHHAATPSSVAWEEMPFADCNVENQVPSRFLIEDEKGASFSAATQSFAQQCSMASRLSSFDANPDSLDPQHPHQCILQSSQSLSQHSSHDSLGLDQLASFKDFASTLQIPPS